MDWGDALVFGLLVISVGALFVQAILASRDQARALKAGEPVGSIWWHMLKLAKQRKPAPPPKPWSGDKPKPLSAAQRKRLNLPASSKPSQSTEPLSKEVRTVFGLHLDLDDEPPAREFAHLHPEPVAPQVVSFRYENAQSERSSRVVTVNQVGTLHLAGTCHQEGQERTFRFDRIAGSATVESGLLVAPSKLRDHLRGYGEQELRRRRRAAAKVAHEILFTGFKADQRAALEAQAVAAGMTVRKRVTLDLDYLCAGPNAGPAKLEEATSRGATVLSPEQFLHLVSTGEAP